MQYRGTGMDNDSTRAVIRQVIGQEWTPHTRFRGLMHNPRRDRHSSEGKIPPRFRVEKQSRFGHVKEFLGRIGRGLKQTLLARFGRR